MSHLATAVIGLKTVTLVLGGLVTYFAWQAYSRTGAKPLRSLAIGFAFVAVGGLLAGAVDQLLGVSRDWAFVVESALTAVGFAVIVHSLYVD